MLRVERRHPTGSTFVRQEGATYNRFVPKRPRQAHIPSQVRKRKVRRPGEAAAGQPRSYPEEPAFVQDPVNGFGAAAFGASGPVDTRPRVGRRLELINRSSEQAAVRVVPGQLPVFERAYLVGELRRIALTAGSLLAIIIVLAIVLR